MFDNVLNYFLVFDRCGTKEWFTIKHLPDGFKPYTLNSYANTVNSKEWTCESDLFLIAAHVTLQPGDMLIIPPYSWHAIKQKEMSMTLSLKGDKEDVISWLAYRYFDGNVDHPMLLSFSHYFYNYTKLALSTWNPIYIIRNFFYSG